MSPRAKRIAFVVSLAAGLAAMFAGGCSGPESTGVTDTTCPPFGDDGNDFRPISAVIERRCGTLDCHGAPARPMRIYGQYGLRRPEKEGSPNVMDPNQYFTGGLEPTTIAELSDNLQSMCGLEPEIMTRVVKKKGEPEDLTLVRKPRLLEKHKGGLLWNKGDDGDACLINWLKGKDDTSPCDKELLHN